MGPAAGLLIIGAAILGIGALASKVAGQTPSSPSSSPPPGPGGSSMASYRNYLQSQGLSKVAAAGVVGNLWQESGGNPKEPGGGLAQWIGARWTALLAFAHTHGLSPDSSEAQLAYLVNDLRGPYSSLLSQLNAATTPGQAATLFSNLYERPSDPQLENRVNYAQQAYAA